MNEPSALDAKTLLVASALESAGIPYAVGGALALMYWSDPRGTMDIDVNVFVSQFEAEPVLNALSAAGVAFDGQRIRDAITATAQVRIDFEGTYLDLFFSNVDFLDSAKSRVRRVPFAGAEIWVLSAEDLVICKAMFNRRKDWADIEQVLAAPETEFDMPYARGWLVTMMGETDERVRDLDLLATASGRGGEVPPSR